MVAGNIFYVPWPDSSEWNTVREQIFSSDVQDTITAYHTILMWKLKYDSVPAYIECTYSLLQVMVKEYEMAKSEQNALVFNENDLRLSYSMALIRFVNHISSISSYKGETLYMAAKTQNIPDWIINIRHDVAHGQDLPALDALHIAVELSLKWLLNNYWGNSDACEQKSEDISSFDMHSGSFVEVDADAQNVFKKFFDVWELLSVTKYRKMQVITEVDREFILHVEEMLSLNSISFSNVENDVAKKLQKIVHAYNQMEESGEYEPSNLCKFKDFKVLLLKFIKNIIIGNDQLNHSLVMSLYNTTFLLDTNFDPSKWQQIICLLQETGSFSIFLETLFEIAGKGHKGATKWLSILPPSIKHLKKQWAVFKVLKRENKNFKTKLIKKRLKYSCKPTDPNLVISLGIFKPPVINLEMLKNILLNPELFSVENIVEYLKLVKPPLIKSTVDMIRDLVSLHVGGQPEDDQQDMEEVSDKVFTVDDVDRITAPEENMVCEEAVSESDGWIKSSIDVSIWNKCPLGLLPFQSKVDCSLPDSLRWKRESTAQKRMSIPLLKHSVSMKKFRKI